MLRVRLGYQKIYIFLRVLPLPSLAAHLAACRFFRGRCPASLYSFRKGDVHNRRSDTIVRERDSNTFWVPHWVIMHVRFLNIGLEAAPL